MAAGGLNHLLRTLVLGGLVALGGWGAWEVKQVFRRHEIELEKSEARNRELERTVIDQRARIAELHQALQLLKVDHRLARLVVLAQGADAAGKMTTTVRFQEIDADGAPLGASREFRIDGRVAYVDALVIKFEDDYVERGDVWRGTSICLFRRLFGEDQSPRDGFPLDPTGKRPVPYGGGADEGAEARLWERFWDYASDAELARRSGVRAMHGEAPYIELRPGASYVIELRASGGLSIRPD